MFTLICGSVMLPFIVYTLIAVMILHYRYCALNNIWLRPRPYKLHGTMRKRHVRAANLAMQRNVHWHGHCMHALVSCHTLCSYIYKAS